MHDIPGIMAFFDAKSKIIFYGPSEIPYAGEYSGAECERFFSTIFETVNIIEFSPQEFIADENMVAVVGTLRLNTKETASEIYTKFVHVITYQDGLLTYFRDFQNTYAVYDAFK